MCNLYLEVFLTLFLWILIFAFPQMQDSKETFPIKTITVNVKNGTDDVKLNSPIYGTISAVKDDFIIKSVESFSENNVLTFENVKVYNNIDFYETTVSYKGINYFNRFSIDEIKKNNSVDFTVYESGNIKDNIFIKRFDYIVDTSHGNISIIYDLVIENKGNFTYSPFLPQKEKGIFIELPENVKEIQPMFNISDFNYKIEKGKINLQTFIKPGDNFFTFRFQTDNDIFPYVVKTKTINKIEELRIILPDYQNKVTTNIIHSLAIKETDNGIIKMGSLKNVDINKDIKITIYGKPNVEYGYFLSDIQSLKMLLGFKNIIIYLGIIIMITGIIYIFVKNKQIQVKG